MTTTCMWELQQAIYTALDGDITLSNLITGVFDNVPQDLEFPYVVMSDIEGDAYNTKTTQGIEARLKLGVFSRNKGRKESYDIMSRVHEILHDANLTLATCFLINLRFVSSEVNVRPDGLTYEGEIIFRVVVEAP